MKNTILLLLLSWTFSSTIYAQTIAEIQGPGAASPYENQEVSTSGIVTAVNANSYFIQDGTAVRSGIYVYDASQSPQVGDLINLTATVTEFYELTELVDVTAFEIVSSGNPLPDPLVLGTQAAKNEDYEGMLIQVLGATCTDTDIGFGEWEADDGSGPLPIDDLFFLYSPMLQSKYNITGVMTFTFDNYKLEPRSENDIEIDLPIYFTISPKETTIEPTSLTITWETNIPASTELMYGLTPNLELGFLFDPNPDDIQHALTISGLEPATAYYVQAYSSVDGNTTPGSIRRMSTASNSSGDIKVYFNHSVDNSLATNELAISTENITDTIISYINRAQETLDITMYEIENEDIVAAINAAYDRGVVIRYLSDDEGNNEILDQLNPSIPLLEGNAGGIMHNKFMIVDRESVDNCWVMTGSMNHTVNNLGWDFNNVICIQDQALANAYFIEFNEMWGSENLAPDPGNAKFGADKTDNTPHCFRIGDRPAELYFSPSDGTNAQIKKVIDEAANEVAFAILVFTENSLGTAVKAAADRGVNVQGIIDYVEFNGSEYDFLVNNGIDVMDYQNADGSQWPDGPTLHHKYAIVDYISGDHPKLITGSHNWTASANSVHDENTLIIEDATLANIYQQEFSARFNGVTNAVREIPFEVLPLMPNPAVEWVYFENPDQQMVYILDINGKVLQAQQFSAGSQKLHVGELPNGIYFIKSGRFLGKVVIEK